MSARVSAVKQKSNAAGNKRRNVAKKIRKNKLGFVPTITVFIIIALIAIPLWNNWTNIKKKTGEISVLTQEHNSRRIKNDALQQKVDAPVDDDYIIDVAIDNGYRKSDEILFYLNPGE